MVYYGSGSDLEKFRFRFPAPDPDNIVFTVVLFFNKKTAKNLAFSMIEAALFLGKLTSHFLFVDFCISFYVGSGSQSGSGMHTGSGSAVPQHCLVCTL